MSVAIRSLYLLPLLLILLSSSRKTEPTPPRSDPRPATIPAPSKEVNWFRGNTHTHTVLCGHADSTAEVVTKWYHDRGYNFLILSEHNKFIDPTKVKMPSPRRRDFILVAGEEVTEKVHSTAMNIAGLVRAGRTASSNRELIQSQVDRALAAGGQLILNHPNFQWAVRQDDMLGVRNLHMFELFNGHPSVRNDGDESHPSTEAIWDYLLSRGMIIYGVSSDDAHAFKPENIKPSKSNPGRGWVMVNARRLTGDSITKAMLGGHFYSSNGVFLEACSVDRSGYTVTIDKEATSKELESPILRGKRVSDGKTGFRIEWIGKEGEVFDTEHDVLASTFKAKKSHLYIRPRVVYTRAHPQGGLEEYYAWGQPQFMDNRLQKLKR